MGVSAQGVSMEMGASVLGAPLPPVSIPVSSAATVSASGADEVLRPSPEQAASPMQGTTHRARMSLMTFCILHVRCLFAVVTSPGLAAPKSSAAPPHAAPPEGRRGRNIPLYLHRGPRRLRGPTGPTPPVRSDILARSQAGRFFVAEVVCGSNAVPTGEPVHVAAGVAHWSLARRRAAQARGSCSWSVSQRAPIP
jgi:hypothetical protein